MLKRFALLFSLLASTSVLLSQSNVVKDILSELLSDADDFARYDSLLGWSLKPGQQKTLETAEFSIELEFNSDGLRDSEYSRVQTSRKRVLVLGDSLVWGWGVEKEKIFFELLDNKYSDWEFINAGVAGYGTDQQLLYLKQRGITYNPDVIILLFNQNDFRNNAFIHQYSYFKPKFILDHDQLVLTGVPVPKSSVFQLISRKTFKHFPNSSLAKWLSEYTHPKGFDELLTLKLLSEINQFANTRSIKFFLMSTPLSNSFQQSLSDFARRESIDYLSLDQKLFRTEENGLFKDGHWNEKGHAMVSQLLEQWLVEKGVLSPKS